MPSLFTLLIIAVAEPIDAICPTLKLVILSKTTFLASTVEAPLNVSDSFTFAVVPVSATTNPISPVYKCETFAFVIAILVIGMGKHWNRVALFHGFVAAVVPAGPFLFDGMLISGEYDIDSSSLDTLRP